MLIKGFGFLIFLGFSLQSLLEGRVQGNHESVLETGSANSKLLDGDTKEHYGDKNSNRKANSYIENAEKEDLFDEDLISNSHLNAIRGKSRMSEFIDSEYSTDDVDEFDDQFIFEDRNVISESPGISGGNTFSKSLSAFLGLDPEELRWWAGFLIIVSALIFIFFQFQTGISLNEKNSKDFIIFPPAPQNFKPVESFYVEQGTKKAIYDGSIHCQPQNIYQHPIRNMQSHQSFYQQCPPITHVPLDYHVKRKTMENSFLDTSSNAGYVPGNDDKFMYGFRRRVNVPLGHVENGVLTFDLTH